MKKEIIEKIGLIKDETKYTNRYKLGSLFVSDEDEFGMKHNRGLIYFHGKRGVKKTSEEFILDIEINILMELLKDIE